MGNDEGYGQLIDKLWEVDVNKWDHKKEWREEKKFGRNVPDHYSVYTLQIENGSVSVWKRARDHEHGLDFVIDGQSSSRTSAYRDIQVLYNHVNKPREAMERKEREKEQERENSTYQKITKALDKI